MQNLSVIEALVADHRQQLMAEAASKRLAAQTSQSRSTWPMHTQPMARFIFRLSAAANAWCDKLCSELWQCTSHLRERAIR